MKSKSMRLAIFGVLVLTLAAGTAQVRAQGPLQLTGVINGFSPATVNPAGPWEIHGTWSLTLNLYTGKADFTADVTMERSDIWVLANMQDPDSTALRMSHTHHIEMKRTPVTEIPGGFQLSGPATITKDGSPAPFSPAALQVDFTGGTSLLISNVALTFGPGANSHFGAVAILGVVGKP